MKLFVLTADFSSESPSWMTIFWPHYNALRDAVPTVLLTTPYFLRGERRFPRLNVMRERQRHARRLQNKIREEVSQSGPNILLVWALSRQDLDRAEFLSPVWDQFDFHVLSVVDNIQPRHIPNRLIERFDLITCFCSDLTREFDSASEVPCRFLPPHTDVLKFGNCSSFRPIDLFVVGRRNPETHTPIHLHFNSHDQEFLSTDFVSRTRNTRYGIDDEFHVLAAAYSRSKIAFCFAADQISRFKGRSPLTERWPHAWASGCTVVGKAPTGSEVAEQMDWPDATIDLPDDPKDAIPFLKELLSDEGAMQRRRERNVVEALRRHDTRFRLRDILRELDVAMPDSLDRGISELYEKARLIENRSIY